MTIQNLHPESASLLRRVFANNQNAGEIIWPDKNKLSEDSLFKDVSDQGMASLFYRRITADSNCPDCPPALLSRLRNITMQQAAHEMLLEADLSRVLDELIKTDVKPLLLKGTPLSHTLYPVPGLRPRCDTDLLIPESAKGRVADLMTRLDYKRLYDAEADFISSQMSFSRPGRHGFHFTYDIHWLVSNSNRDFSRRFADNNLFSTAIPVPALGKHARTLNHADALILACFHRAGHFSQGGDRLIWLYDIHLLCQILSEEQLLSFCHKVRKLEIITLCADAIATAKSWFDTELPKTLKLLLRENAPHESSALYLQAGRVDGIRNHVLLELKGLSTWQERFHFLLQNAFPPTKYMLWRYDSKQKIILPWLYFKRFLEGIYIFLAGRG